MMIDRFKTLSIQDLITPTGRPHNTTPWNQVQKFNKPKRLISLSFFLTCLPWTHLPSSWMPSSFLLWGRLKQMTGCSSSKVAPSSKCTWEYWTHLRNSWHNPSGVTVLPSFWMCTWTAAAPPVALSSELNWTRHRAVKHSLTNQEGLGFRGFFITYQTSSYLSKNLK